jgi:phage baseplate assembly protein W
MPQQSTFKDLSVVFKKHPVTDDLVTVKDKVAIAQSISNLLQTNTGERPFNPDLGSGIRELLFEQADWGTAAALSGRVKECLIKYEPRISVLACDASPDFDNNGFDIEIEYEILGRDDGKIVAEVFLERTR